MRFTSRKATCVLMLSALSACADNAEIIDLGDDTPPSALGASLVDYAGTWDGYVEAFSFSDGSDRIRVRLESDGTGVLEVGDSEQSPAPTKEDVQTAVFAYYQNGPAPAFDYAISEARVEDQRIRFSLASKQNLDKWCALWTPMLGIQTTGEPLYSCLPVPGALFTGDQMCKLNDLDEAQSVPCGSESCAWLCHCGPDTCSADYDGKPSGNDLVFDATLEQDGDKLVGTLKYLMSGFAVHLTRR
jgi:hypothetical protein